MIVKVDMHIRDERLLEWLQDKDNQNVTANVIAVQFKCHRHTVYAMLKRLRQAGYIEIIPAPGLGNKIRIIPCNQNSH